MSAWWTYSLRDFLLFSPATYRRLIEQYNAGSWPAQWIGTLACLAILALLVLRVAHARRIVALVLAAVWAAVAWDFLAGHYASINWAASYVAMAFGVQAGLFVLLGLRPRVPGAPPAATCRARLATASGVAMLALAAAYPAVAWAAGGGIDDAEWFGLMPDPTVVGTLGALVLLPGRGRAWLAPIPLAALALGAATAHVLRAPQAWLLAGTGVCAVVAFAAQARAKAAGGPSA